MYHITLFIHCATNDSPSDTNDTTAVRSEEDQLGQTNRNVQVEEVDDDAVRPLLYIFLPLDD